MGGPGSGRRKAVENVGKDRPAAEATVTSSTSGPPLLKVTQPTGGTIEVQGKPEQDFYNLQKKKYLAENKFTAVTDLADLDKVLFMELLDFRWTLQLGRGQSYDGSWLTTGEEEQYRRNKSDAAKITMELKSKLGLTREKREAAEGSVPDYIKELRKRAGEFGVFRNEQIVKAIVLAKELKSIVLTWQRSNDVERRTVGIETEADIVKWILEVFIPGFEEVDKRFRKHQKLWVGKL